MMKKLFLTYAVVMLSTFIYGQFGPQNIIVGDTNNVSQPQSVVSTDVDGDGNIDVVVASFFDNKVCWYRNIGSGIFGDQQIISDQIENARFVFAEDIDDDGDVDVIATSGADGKIVLFINEGDGNFGQEQIIYDTGYIESAELCVADLDGDGDKDVVSVDKFGNRVIWFENDGSENFGPIQIVVNSILQPRGISVSDVDGDGTLDVITFSFWDDKITWYPNNGDGSFGEEHIISVEFVGPRKVRSEDIDGDGDMDVVVIYNWYSSHEIAWFRNDGNGNFEPANVIFEMTTAPGFSTLNLRYMRVADVDLDGDMDVIASGIDAATSWYQNDGNGNFESPQYISSPRNVKDVSAADFDNDGDMDVVAVTARPFGGEIVWYGNDGLNNFDAGYVISSQADGALSVISADIDGDGDMDVLSASSTDFTGEVAWYPNDGNGNFDTQIIIVTKLSTISDIDMADVDGDGDLDVICAYDELDLVVWFQNYGNGTFGEETYLSNHNNVQFVYTTDLDGNGALDVITTGYTNNVLVWSKNIGSGLFMPGQTITTIAGEIVASCTADLDGDGDNDFIIASSNLATISWVENTGSSIFGSPQPISVQLADGVKSLSAADMDGDGDMDIISASSLDNKIAWYRNDGTGSFAPQQIISTQANGAMAVYVEDIDNDGDMDVVSASLEDDKIAWHENDGSGNFGIQQIISSQADGARGVYAVDMDGDGDLDVISVSENDDKIAWYENLIAETVAETIALKLKVFLQGPFESASASMSDNIHSLSSFPLEEPYTQLGETIVGGGGETIENLDVLSATGANAIVDWVFVELRDGEDPTQIIQTVSGLLQRDGDVVSAADGFPLLNFIDPSLTHPTVLVAIRHRNHFGVRLLDPITLVGGDVLSVNFGDPTLNIFGQADEMLLVGNTRLLRAGDADHNGVINVIDRNDYWQVQNSSAYNYFNSSADFNLDGTVNAIDRNAYWQLNNGKSEALE